MNFLAINIRGIGDLEKPGWINILVKEHKILFLCMQETQVSNVDSITIGRYWGKVEMEYESVDARGRSGGLVSAWDPGVFSKQRVVKHDSFLLISGVLAGTNTCINAVNVYASCEVTRRRALWEELKTIKDTNGEGLWIMAGDFNEVREEDERMISRFDNHGAMIFNNLISEAGLLEYQMSGYKYTYMTEDGSNLSKIDRVLVCDAFIGNWPCARFEALARHLLDHSPLQLSCATSDYGPIPFRFYNSWIEDNGIEEVVKKVLEESNNGGNNMRVLANILKNLKFDIKEWRRVTKLQEEKDINEATEEVATIEKLAESRRLTTLEKEKRILDKWKIRNYERKRLKDLKQRAKLKWAKLGDENSNFFHRTINCRKAQNRINAMKIGGIMVNEPKAIKEEFRTRFLARFTEPITHRPTLDGSGFKQITGEQATLLTSSFSKQEIKEVVWACGSDRAPGPNGFLFKFIKRFWAQLENNIVGVMNDFHERAFIERGCNASFIALIPKVKDPFSVNDFRPISLIGVI
ncbi:uncharacterized protein LOC110924424 [Helianthus annuus]|uniref:uncharacterized protein LOC110924424 n=1 Tax=Helianthus annuus TaxID=4232 RepID=UPI000B9056FD|nr:uncharacterized protein LOC110924424 [Helianthus annuus]